MAATPKRALSPDQAVARAAAWWDKTGRFVMNKHANEEKVGRKIRTSTGLSPAILIQGETKAVINSGILQAHEFDQLTREEKLRIVRVWLDFYAPDVDVVGKSQQTQDMMKRWKLH